MSDKEPGDLWESLGSLDEFEAMQVLTRLFSIYEGLLENDPENPEQLKFFKNLEQALGVVQECNLNRR
ncbi:MULTISPECIES: hypothetical protein [Desulfosediminicola]|uniref:hypothetical protein n=1 Tax=Desulfosediminicola TaxID=2886823 RepID=UPI0010AD8B45|nr:hypothetical protein [Desulfosediminicola ganghwensis]